MSIFDTGMIYVYILLALSVGGMLYFMVAPCIRGRMLTDKFDPSDHIWWVGLISIVLFILMWVVRFNFVGAA